MVMVQNSILDTTKKVLGIDSDYVAFDLDIIMHINSVFGDLHQLGVGPDVAYEIEDSSNLWSDFMGSETAINSVKTYVYLRLRLIFDPPSTSFAIESMQKQIDKLEFRLNVQREEAKYPWVAPIVETDSDVVI